MATPPGTLFGLDAPAGFDYREEFITVDEERTLAEAIGGVEFSAFEMRGVVARRRVALFGASYNGGPVAAPDIPAFLLTLRERLGTWAGLAPAAFVMALINEYPPGAPIGWHRDAPEHDIVAGVSLLSPCRMKFRPYASAARAAAARRVATHEVLLAPRSAYLMTGAARNAFEHHIPAVSALRYSITFRSRRG